jgi:hypothetical protein
MPGDFVQAIALVNLDRIEDAGEDRRFLGYIIEQLNDAGRDLDMIECRRLVHRDIHIIIGPVPCGSQAA